ncbi:hypothetical protein SAMN00017477_0099 [Peptoniphilus asaccharolyticus DSM 20463]|uniref:Uncharacterized protein n=1 Tax=Peptoniphilus asaccharolyticus DSM 20463 TaxID=573058 RepID=A0A1W1UCK9_PEPAS|nr:hypothetical protein [Peptoniphilus asaccharolyticus]MBL7576463.1 hypothetical protein [Peptoniphilus asaccharolyticus]SMB78790.1 hypothetical protein SAMN00017477_0099 [Peptoniphilus asaccharolyticus DSM 20463]
MNVEKNNIENIDFYEKHNKKIKEDLEKYINNSNLKYEFMTKSEGCHHENIGSFVVLNNKEIREYIEKECGENAPTIISDMITGNTERKDITNPILVQILHSELDADGIDYLMRDAMFSGTSFGQFEMEQLIGCMEIGEYKNNKVLCINPKGIAAADQYLINKFFSFSQVVFNKHISVTEFMAEKIIDWMQKNNAFFPRKNVLQNWTKFEDNESTKKYIEFTDNHFWRALHNVINDELSEIAPEFIKKFSEMLINHSELKYIENSEVKVVSSDIEEIKKIITESDTYKNIDNSNKEIVLMHEYRLSKQIPKKIYDKILKEKFERNFETGEDITEYIKEDITEYIKEDIENLKIRRLMECICIKDGDDVRLLSEDNRSLIKTLWNLRVIILRKYK